MLEGRNVPLMIIPKHQGMSCFVALCPSVLLLCVTPLPHILALLSNPLPSAVFDSKICSFFFIVLLHPISSLAAQVFSSFEALLLALCPGYCSGLCVISIFTLSAALLLLASDIGMLTAPRYVPPFLSAHLLINNSVSASLISLLERYNCLKDNKTQKFYSSPLILSIHLSPLTSKACVIFVVIAKKIPFYKTVVLSFGPISPTLPKHGMCIFRHSSSQFLILVQWISPSMCPCFVPQHQPYFL